MRVLSVLPVAGLALANPLPLPTPPPLRDAPITPLDACTYTITSYNRGFTGDWAPTKTSTKYTSTVTGTTSIDCQGCPNFAILHTVGPGYGGLGPMMAVNWVTATEATTVFNTVCAATAVTPHPLRQAIPTPPILPRVDVPVEDPSNCTFTKTVPFHMTFGPIKTVWAKTVTDTQSLDCGGVCRYVTTKTAIHGGHGPVVHYTATTTITEEAHRETAFACQKPVPSNSGQRTLPIVPTGVPPDS